MNVLVFGASGGTGRELVAQALALGHAATAFVRNPSKLKTTHALLRVLQGDVTDPGSVEHAVAGQDAALCALGSPSPSRRNPAFVDGVRNVIAAMGRAGVRRLVYLSFIGVHESRQEAGFFIRSIAARLLRAAIADHEANEDQIRRSPLRWTIVRPPKLTTGRHTGLYRSGEHLAARSLVPTLSRADLAEFMLKQVTDETYLHKAPGLMH